jgi:hypothetical protein
MFYFLYAINPATTCIWTEMPAVTQSHWLTVWLLVLLIVTDQFNFIPTAAIQLQPIYCSSKMHKQNNRKKKSERDAKNKQLADCKHVLASGKYGFYLYIA